MFAMSIRSSSTAALVFALLAAASVPARANDDTGADCDVAPDVSDVGDDVAPDASDVGDDVAPDVSDVGDDVAPDVSDTGDDADVAEDPTDISVGDTGDVADVATDAADTAGDVADPDASDTAVDASTDAEDAAPEPLVHTLTLNISAFARGDTTANAALQLDGPEALELSVDAPGSIEVDVQAGTYSVSVSANGFDPVLSSVVVLSDSEFSAALYPDTPVEFTGQVMLGPNRLEGADIVLTGRRSSAPIVSTSGAQGRFTISEIPAGFYDIEVSYNGGWLAERNSVDLLGDTEMAFLLPVLDEERTIETTRSACTSSASSPVTWFAALGLLAWVRRR